jgi:phage shock protein A
MGWELYAAHANHALGTVNIRYRQSNNCEELLMGLFGRISTIIKAKTSKLLDRAEDPNETLDYGYQKQMELLQNVKKGIADVVTAKKRLQMQSDKLAEQVAKLDGQARAALAQGQEPLAREALTRKQIAQTQFDGLQPQITELAHQQEQLVDKERQMRIKIDQFRTQKEVIKAQYSAAQAQVKISSAASGIGGEMDNLGLALQRASEKTENMRARAAAVDELDQAGTFDDVLSLGSGADDIDRQLAQVSATTAIDDELSQMKSELGSGAAPAALGSGAAEPATADADQENSEQ